ncbi:adenosylcobinamide amidohydrolase [Thiohalorhabdus denitrificans]|uniref:Adenosylcobinamide amidohydrolase n=1 Tax=Thiohalorhabdus denitrificans TaxID=381306 RepID=A0A1G5HR59_9GAMM|nr:adenosylcobinamide amidohydrolase [Thiohalorhabdus denitrificans]SCY65518.1 Adenosylcobinamide amidohydrolase [Thiohalorhabdus denitrificans]
MRFAPGVTLERHPRWNALAFDRPCPVLSSAPVGGGDRLVRRIVNLCVHGDGCLDACADPEATFAGLAAEQGWGGALTGLMTAVSAQDLGVGHAPLRDPLWSVLATAGTSNAHRAGEPAPVHPGAGTINIIAVTGQGLTAAARAEALALVAEAKAGLLADLGRTVPGSGRIATGTGTDAVAIASEGGADTPYSGYHTESGQALVAAVREAVGASLALSGERGAEPEET